MKKGLVRSATSPTSVAIRFHAQNLLLFQSSPVSTIIKTIQYIHYSAIVDVIATQFVAICCPAKKLTHRLTSGIIKSDCLAGYRSIIIILHNISIINTKANPKTHQNQHIYDICTTCTKIKLNFVQYYSCKWSTNGV